jgi:hypothetical protein
MFPFSPFQGIPNDGKPFLKSLRLEKWELEDPELLLESLEGCHELEDLALVNVYWEAEFKRKIWLPNLRRFSLKRAIWNWNITTMSTQELMASIFFYTDQAAFQSWNQSSIYTSRAEITLEGPDPAEFYELKFSLSFDLTKLRVMNYPHDLSKYFPYTELDLKATVWDVAAASTNNITHVTARDLQFINWNQPPFPHLTSLTLELTNEPRLELDLSLLPIKTLEEISLSNIDLVSTSALPIRFEALQSLKLYSLCFNTSGGIFSSPSLKSLYLHDLMCPRREFFDFSGLIRNQTGLVDFRLGLRALGSFDLSDLGASRATLEHLDLADIGFVCQSAPFQFSDLKTLRLTRTVIFKPLKLFHRTFQNLGTIGFEDFSFKPGFLKAVLKTRVQLMEFSSFREVRMRADLKSFFAQAGIPLSHFLYTDECELRRINQTWEYKVLIKYIYELFLPITTNNSSGSLLLLC